MKLGKIAIFTFLLSLLIINSGCAWWKGEKPSLDMMKIMPLETTSLVYWDIQALRDSKDLAVFYDDPKSEEDWVGKEGGQLSNFGIDCPSVRYFAIGGEEGTTKVFKGDFNRQAIRDALFDLDYSRQSYPGGIAEMWIGPSEEYKAIGLVKDVVIIGDEVSVDDFIAVFRNEKSSLHDDKHAREVVKRLPNGIAVVVTKVKESPPYHLLLAWGVSYERKEEGILKIRVVYRFDGKGAAENALLNIGDYWDSQRDYYQVKAKHVAEFVEVTALMATKNFSYSDFKFLYGG